MTRLLRAPGLGAVAGVAHGFTTREGGVSTGPLSSLNLARRPGESDEHLVENWGRVLGALGPGVDPKGLALADQVHGDGVIVARSGLGPLATLGEADALVTTTPGVVLGVRTADCVPVLLAAPGGVAAVHSGWRGTAEQVSRAALQVLLDETGADVSQVRAVVGPAISGARYEVGEEVVEALAATGIPLARFLVPAPTPHVHVGRAVVAQLEALGVPLVEHLDLCVADDRRFYSHRRDRGQTGRQAGVIALLP